MIDKPEKIFTTVDVEKAGNTGLVIGIFIGIIPGMIIGMIVVSLL